MKRQTSKWALPDHGNDIHDPIYYFDLQSMTVWYQSGEIAVKMKEKKAWIVRAITTKLKKYLDSPKREYNVEKFL